MGNNGQLLATSLNYTEQSMQFKLVAHCGWISKDFLRAFFRHLVIIQFDRIA